MQTFTAEQFKSRYGQAGVDAFSQPKPTQSDTGNFFTNTGASFKASEGGNAGDLVSNLVKTSGNIPSSSRDLARGLIAPVNPFDTGSSMNIGKNIVESLGATKDIIKSQGLVQGTKSILGGFADTYLKIGESIYGGLDKAYNAFADNPEKALTDVATHISKKGIEDPMFIPSLLYGGGKAGEKDLISSFASPITRGADTSITGIASNVAERGKGAFDAGVANTKRITEKLMPAIKPEPTALEAVGQVLQGQTKDIKSGVKSLSSLDTKGVNTFSGLKTKITDKITELSQKVDADLALDPTKRKLVDLVVNTSSKGGKIVKLNPVEDALNQLDELYIKTGDKVGSQNIREVINEAKINGLTNQEVNDIARTYGQEFSSKAFGKTGEPLTSVNAQMYENTRRGIKSVARSGIKGAEAQKADKLMSDLYNTQTKITQNVEAVNKLRQKIQERGLFEKFGHALSKYGDILTGGSIRGFIGGLLPRGAGYKVMNALDLESALSKNLEIINKAIKSGSEADIEAVLKNLK